MVVFKDYTIIWLLFKGR